MVRRNIVANYAGGMWSALMSFAFVPLYIRWMGIEAYGLVGIFASMQIWLAMLDMGIAPAISREMARFQAGAHDARSILELFHSIEIIYVAAAAVLCGIMVLAAPWVAERWLQVQSLPVSVVGQALMLIAAVVCVRWVCALYRGVLIGLQRQVLLSGWNASFATLRGAGVVLALLWIAPTVQVFFVYQLLVAGVELLVLTLCARVLLPRRCAHRRFSRQALGQIWPFAGGMAIIVVLSVLLGQVDKLLLSKLLTLSEFGYYTLAYTVAGVLHLMTTPVGNAAYPRLTELVTKGDDAEIASAYHMFAQTLTAVLAPIALVMAVFSDHLLLLWTRDQAITAAAAPLLSMLLIGNLFNGMMNIPYNLQLAHGWTRFTIQVNTVALFIVVPLIWFGATKLGAVAAAGVWILLNAGYLLIAVPLMHRKLLRTELWRWYRQDVCIPLLAIAAATILVRMLAPPAQGSTLISIGLTLIVAACVASVVAALTVPLARTWVLGWLGARLAWRPQIRKHEK